MSRDITFYPNYLHYNNADFESNGNFAVTTQPSISGITYTSSGGETSGGAYDLVDNKRASIVTIDSNASSATVTIGTVLTTALNGIDTAIIDYHNFGTSKAKAKISNGATVVTVNSGYSSTSKSVGEAYHGLQLGAETISGDAISPAYDGLILFNLASIGSSSDLRVLLLPTISAYPDDITIGEICFSRKFTPTFRPALITREVSTFGTELLTTKGGQNYGHGTHGERKGWTLTYEYMTLAQKQSMEQVFRVTKGGRYPMYVDLGETASPLLYYCRFVPDTWNVAELTSDAYQVTFDLITEI